MDTPQNEGIVEKELGHEDMFLLTLTVRVTATTTHKTVFFIVIKKEHLQFF